MSRFALGRNFEDELARDPGVVRVLEERTDRALVAARRIAQGFKSSGDYEQSLKARGTRLLTTDRAGHIFEWGGGNSPVRAPLRKAAQQVGARYEDTGRG